MQKEINKLINSMDVKQNREDAELKAYSIIKFGVDALDSLIEIGTITSQKNMDAIKKKKILRAVILTFLIFIEKNNTSSFKKVIISKAKSLLFKLATQGYASAMHVIYKLGFYDSDIQKEQLLSLPIVEKNIHDKEISINEALSEIKIGKFYTGFKGIQNDHYIIGTDGKHIHQIYRIRKDLFGLRASKSSKR